MKAPTVIIGVGGIGAEICATIAMREENSSLENVRFVILDTDVNSIRELHRKGFRGTEILLTDNMTVERCKDSITGTQDWYPESDIFNGKPMTEGAGQQRAISRLALDYSIREGKLTPLCEVIQELNELTMDDSEQQMRFYIISSLAGGTGSGLILPLALYLNRFVFEEFGDNLSVCKGFFVLSSALRSSVGTRLEQKSLDSNAYAAVKELSAFMQMADDRQGRYSDLAITLAGSDTSSYDKYQNMAYEYCYLFGMVNGRGKRMHSFAELKALVAQAVHMQACSPMHDRNSSREDNTIKHITYKMLEEGKKKLSRFGGIGCGELIYPYSILKKYYALEWALESMESSWQAYDRKYLELEQEQREKKKLGKKVIPICRGTEYVNSISLAEDTDRLAERIRSLWMGAASEPWKDYLDAVEAEIGRRVEERRKGRCQSDTQDEKMFLELLELMVNKAYRKGKKITMCNEAVMFFKRIKPEILGIAAEFQGQQTAHFFELHEPEQEQQTFYLEYWLQKDGEFIHPNAVRYFLYQLQKAVEEKLEMLERRMEQGKWIRNRLDRKQTVNSWKQKRAIKVKEEQRNYIQAYNELYQYVRDQISKRVLEKIQNYVRQLVENYEAFYDSFGEMLIVFAEEKELCMKELDRDTGIPKSYVCADDSCRRAVFEEMRKRPEFQQTGSALSYKIYELMHEKVETGIQRKRHFQTIENYWVEDMEEKFRDIFDMNILHAMDREGICRNGRHLRSEEMTERIKLVRKILIAPFLQYDKMAGEEQGISICCYNSCLNEEHGEFLKTVRWLQEHEGVDDATYCDPYRIMFYRSFVGLDAGKVMEYLHWDRKKRFKGNGKAFRFYEQTLLDMGKSVNGKSQITPHLDKGWHSLLEIPDTDSGYQHKKELDIAKALLYGVLSGVIKREAHGYSFLFYDSAGVKYDSLSEVHRCLYYNLQAQKMLSDSMKREIEQDYRNGENKFLQRVINYKDGIFQILIDYNAELPIGKRDRMLNEFLIAAVSLLLEACLERDKEDVETEKRRLLTEEWKKHKEPKDCADRTKMIIGQIDNYIEKLSL